MKRKVLSAILAISMVLTILPVNILALDVGGNDGYFTGKVVQNGDSIEFVINVTGYNEGNIAESDNYWWGVCTKEYGDNQGEYQGRDDGGWDSIMTNTGTFNADGEIRLTLSGLENSTDYFAIFECEQGAKANARVVAFSTDESGKLALPNQMEAETKTSFGTDVEYTGSATNLSTVITVKNTGTVKLDNVAATLENGDSGDASNFEFVSGSDNVGSLAATSGTAEVTVKLKDSVVDAGTYTAVLKLTGDSEGGSASDTTTTIALSATVNKAEIDLSSATVAGIGATKEYDGKLTGAALSATGATIETGVGSEKLLLAIAGTPNDKVDYTDDKDVSADHTYSLEAKNLTLSDNAGAKAANYKFANGKTKAMSNGAVTAKKITFTATDTFTVQMNVDTDLSTKANYGFTGLVSGETLALDTDFEIAYMLADAQSSGISAPATGHTVRPIAATTGTPATMTATASLKATDKAKNYEIVTSGSANVKTLNITVSAGKETSQEGAPAEVFTTGEASTTTWASVQDAINSELAKVVIRSTTESNKVVTGQGTWSTAASGALAQYGANTATYTWNAVGYAPQDVTITVNLRKLLTNTDFEVVSTTCQKTYDNKANLPTGAQIQVKTSNQAESQPLVLDITGQYCKAADDASADVNVDASKNFVVTGVKTDLSANAYYALPSELTGFIVGGAKINQATPTLKLDNLSQTAGSVTAVTVTPDPASGDFTDANYAVLYEIKDVQSFNAANCSCGAADHLFHTTQCAGVKGSDLALCDCGAGASVALTELHDSGCAYGGDSQPSTGHATAHCDCSKKTVADITKHTAECAAITKADAFHAWGDTVMVGGVSKTVEDIVKAAAANTTFKVKATSTATTNLAAQTTPVEGVLTINAKSSGGSSGGGGGSSVTTYTVKFDAGEHGTIKSGSKSVSVEKNKTLAASKIPTVEAKDGWKFLGWSVDGKTVVDPSSEKVTKSITYKALYEQAGAEQPTEPTAKGFDRENTGSFMNGYPDGTFAPEASMTRGEVAAVIARTLLDKMEEGKTYAADYSDVSASLWSAESIGFLAQLGVIGGYSDGSFKPEQSITRAEFVTMVMRVDGLVSGGADFPDVDPANWAAEYIAAASAKGYVGGYADGSFKPNQAVTRAEAAKILNGVLGRGDKPAASGAQFSDVAESHWAFADISKAVNGVQ